MLAETEAYGLKFLVPARDETVGRALLDTGEFARIESDFIAQHLRAGDHFVDIGANLGAICLPVAKTHPGVEVTAVEASPSMANLLAANALGNLLTNVHVLQAAAGPVPQIVPFPDVGLGAGGNLGAVGFHTPRQTRNVRMLTLDEIATPQTRFVKIDVEGYETEVLKGAARTLAEVRPFFLLEANPGGAEPWRAGAQMLLDAGYALFWFFAPFGTPKTSRTKLADPSRGDTNIVAVPAGAELGAGWDLTPLPDAAGERPKSGRAYPYLADYGFPLPRA